MFISLLYSLPIFFGHTILIIILSNTFTFSSSLLIRYIISPGFIYSQFYTLTNIVTLRYVLIYIYYIIFGLLELYFYILIVFNIYYYSQISKVLDYFELVFFLLFLIVLSGYWSGLLSYILFSIRIFLSLSFPTVLFMFLTAYSRLFLFCTTTAILSA